MYILHNNIKYPCKCRPASTMRYSGLPEDFPAPVSGEIVLCADDGFVLRTDSAEDFLRQNFEGGILTFTNIPEFEPQPAEEEPVDPQPTPEERIAVLEESLAETDEAAIELYEATLAQEAVNAEQDEAIIEIYEMLGGE